ncbi:MAG: bifunctional folylpolyglutamate synthase/dihydrofolate synthase [Lachnospiraceae bacterium]|nr:bifunctional folylpolyglutamate synthase/dihydrofolate synthase [Lachnospiraceae bacterium]
MTYEEALSYIHKVNWLGVKPGLDRTRELLAKLGNPEQELKFVHIAGTNGKGSTAAMTASVLEQAGYRVGLYTSPFIHRFNERMQVNGESIGDEELAELTEMIRPLAESMEDAPTEFELITALAMEYFRRHACEIVVLEVGLGGELDSTNVISVPEVAVITSIGLDHTAVLGNTLAEIASAKAGIIKEGGDVVSYGKNPEADAVIGTVCREKKARLHRPDYDSLRPVCRELTGQTFDYGTLQGLRIPLLGLYQLDNAAVALTALDVLREKGWKITEEDMREGLAATRWTGRLELLSEHPAVIVDGSHNPPGIRATAESLRTYFGNHKIIFLVGVMADKDVDTILSTLCPLAGRFITVTPDNPGRAMPAEELAERLRSMGELPVTAAASIGEGCRTALAYAGADGVVCALGSLYMVGDMTREMKKCLNE